MNKSILIIVLFSLSAVLCRTVRYVQVPYNIPVRVIYDDVYSQRIMVPSKRHLEYNDGLIYARELKNRDEQVPEKLIENTKKESNIVETFVKPDGSSVNDRVDLLNEDATKVPINEIKKPLIDEIDKKPETVETNEISEEKIEENIRNALKNSEDHIAQIPNKPIVIEAVSNDEQTSEKQSTPASSTGERPTGPLASVQQAFGSFINRITGNRNSTQNNSTSSPPFIQNIPNPIATFSNAAQSLVNRFTNRTQTNETSTPQAPSNNIILAIPQQISNAINRITGNRTNGETQDQSAVAPTNPILQIPQTISNTAQNVFNTFTGNRNNNTENVQNPPSPPFNPFATIGNAAQNVIDRFTGGNRNNGTENQNSTGGNFITQGISNAAQSVYNTINRITGNQNNTSSTERPAQPPLGSVVYDSISNAVNNIRPVNIISRLNQTFNPAANPAPNTQVRDSIDLKTEDENAPSQTLEEKPTKLPEENLISNELPSNLPIESSSYMPVSQEPNKNKPVEESEPIRDEPKPEKPLEDNLVNSDKPLEQNIVSSSTETTSKASLFEIAVLNFQRNALEQIQRFREAINAFIERLNPDEETNSFEGASFAIIKESMNQVLNRMEENVNRTVELYLAQGESNTLRASLFQRLRNELQDNLNSMSKQFRKWVASFISGRNEPVKNDKNKGEQIPAKEEETDNGFSNMMNVFVNGMNTVYNYFTTQTNQPTQINETEQQNQSQGKDSRPFLQIPEKN